MSKITISAVLTVLRLAIGLTRKIIRLLYVIIDLVDDGCVNDSVQRPDWMSSVLSVLNSSQHLLDDLLFADGSVSDSLESESLFHEESITKS